MTSHTADITCGYCGHVTTVGLGTASAIVCPGCKEEIQVGEPEKGCAATECFRCGVKYTRDEFIGQCSPDLQLTSMYSEVVAAAAPNIAMDMRHCVHCDAPVSMVVEWGVK